MSSRVHTAGIIPVANLKTNIDVAYPEILLPVCNGLSAIQKSVFECAMAGCKTIWIVANNDLAPIIRKTVGDWVYDPVYYERTHTKFYAEHRKEIPIYYVPIHPKDRDRRDSYGWSILHGVYSAWYTAYKISRWILPENYYISFPMSIYNVYDIRNYRKEISNTKQNFFLSHQNKTAQDNEYLSFTMTGEDFKKCRNHINQSTTREYLPPSPGEKYPSQKLPLEDRWSARHFQLSQILQAIENKDVTLVDVQWYYNLSEWDEYVKYMSSDNLLEMPEKELTRPRTHANIPYTLQEGTNESD